MIALLVTAGLSLGTSPAEAQIKVAALGASTTRGTGSTAGHSYPDELGRLLGSGYQVRNHGRGGATVLRQTPSSYWSSPELAAALASQPAIALLWMGAADTRVEYWDGGKAQFLPDFVALIQRVQALPSKPRVFVLLSSARADDGAVRARVVNEEVQPLQRQGAMQTGATIIDVPAALMGRAEHYADGIHLNDSGYLVVARLVAAAIQSPSTPPTMDAGVDAVSPADAGPAAADAGPDRAADLASPEVVPDPAPVVDASDPGSPSPPAPGARRDAAPSSTVPPPAASTKSGGCDVSGAGAASPSVPVLGLLAWLLTARRRRRGLRQASGQLASRSGDRESPVPG